MKRIFFFIYLLLGLSFLQAQTEYCKPILLEAREAMDEGDFSMALDRLQKLETCDRNNVFQSERQKLQSLIFDRIERQRKDALQNEKKALAATKAARIAQAQAEQEKRKADSTLRVANQVLSQMYFYEGKFGLTLKNIGPYHRPNYKYGFINKQGREVIPFQFEEATPFSQEDGFARVSRGGGQYLLDTAGVSYLLATSFEELSPEIEALDIHEGSYTAFPDSIGSFPNLKVILAYGQAIDSLPESIGNLSALISLYLSGTQLTSLPESIGNLSALTSLYLQHNQQLTSLPESIGNLSALTYLNLCATKVLTLPSSFGKLSMLETFHYCDIPLKKLSDPISLLPNLRKLDIETTEIDSLPTGILHLIEKNEITLVNAMDNDGINLYQIPLEYIPSQAYVFLDEKELTGLALSVFKTGKAELPLQIVDTLISRQPDRASFYCQKALYAIYAKEYDMGISAAKKAVSLAPDSIKSYAPMALAYLLSGQYNEAEQIYEKWKDSTYSVKGIGYVSRKPMRETFLEDLDRLEKFNISHPDVEKIRALLNEEVEVAVEEE